jgi:hypothetical protein
MGLLRLLTVEIQRSGEDTSVLEGEIDFDRVGTGHGEAHSLGIEDYERYAESVLEELATAR